MRIRRTKIVATLGPATRDPEVLKSLLGAGVDVVRLNLAHADPPTHLEASNAVRKESDRLGREIAILVDLPGPKMRTGSIAGNEVALEAGQSFILYSSDRLGDAEGVGTTVERLADLIEIGDDIFLADGAIILKVMGVENGDVHTEVVRRGLLRSRKGMHVPRAEAKIPSFSQDDREALDLALHCRADLIGLSFIRDVQDIEEVRGALSASGDAGRQHPLLVAKIETRSAIEHLDKIVRAADAVMVARGDLGIQMPFQEVPLLQKQIIGTCNRSGIPVITATQMLESMTHGPLPSRAEVNDVANAVLDGTDALMLSEETAVGKYPVATVETMDEIASAAERKGDAHLGYEHHEDSDDPVSWAIARATVHAAEELNVAAILCPTRSGATARRVASFRPRMPIVGLSQSSEIVRSLALVWGVIPMTVAELSEEMDAGEAIMHAVDAVRDSGFVRSGDLVAVVAGGPEPRTGSTDFVRIVSA
ncbi:MAG: pyruvate kinase [Actinomycetota bacterium]|nr:pyruvate kinase [Actinomycetota bacterium]